MVAYSNDSERSRTRAKQEELLKQQKRKQPGVTFPSARRQEHILLVRFNIMQSILSDQEKGAVRQGLKRLCTFLDRIDNGLIKINSLTEGGDIKPTELSEFEFSATIGFGKGFFQKVNISSKNCPNRIKDMPDYMVLGDTIPYSIFQTDFMVQLGSDDYYVNRWVYQSSTSDTTRDRNNQIEDQDIYTCVKDWARIVDINAGFQRIDGKNLLGFNDGISNPNRLSNDVVWCTKDDEIHKFTDGTYMVFQKIEHDLDRWLNLSIAKQEEWVGRSKATGLLLGTLSINEDRKLGSEMQSANPMIRASAMKKWKKLYDEQKDPDKKFFTANEVHYRNIQANCPVWSHVRKANPRQADGAARHLMFRRGYLFIEGGLNGRSTSGLLFICFQRDIENGFEYIKKNFLNNEDFPVPSLRKKLTQEELARRQLSYTCSGVVSSATIHNQNTGRDGLSGPSELAAYPQGQVAVTTATGGGYYFIPPIPNKKISEISEQFFE
jgi:Dyp-type peroxidase family